MTLHLILSLSCALLTPALRVTSQRRAVPAQSGLIPLARHQRHQQVAMQTVGEATKKRHSLLTFGFTGTGYYGLESHTAEGDPEKPTVTDVVRRALLDTGFIAPTNFSPLQRTKWSLASRTDKGVHAACAAASVKLETLAEDVIDSGTALSLGSGSAHEAASDWSLSDTALARLNGALPPHIRVFSACRVRKGFDARECACTWPTFDPWTCTWPVHVAHDALPCVEWHLALRCMHLTWDPALDCSLPYVRVAPCTAVHALDLGPCT